MSYSDIKITQADINENNVRSASDILIGDADDNKAVFDKLPEFIAGKHNELVDALDEVSEHAQGDTEEIDRLSEEKVNVPKNGTELDYGEAGQMLTTKGNGETQWEDAGQPTDEQTQNAINNWLDAHPEATTTVQDGSLTEPKFSEALKLKAIKDYVTPEMFGAKGDGVTDDYNAIISAIAAATEEAKTLYFFEKDYYVTQSIVIENPSFNILMDGKLVSELGDITLQIGKETSYFQKFLFRLNVKNISSEIIDGSIGVKIINMYDSEVYLNVEGFDVGFQLVGNNSGSAYNSIYYNNFWNNKVSVNLHSENNGWVNENRHYGGRFSISSSFTYAAESIGVKMDADNNGLPLNNNTFFAPCVEGLNIGFDIEYGQRNHILNARTEATTTPMVCASGSFFNDILIGFGNYPGELGFNSKADATDSYVNEFNTVVFDSGYMPSVGASNADRASIAKMVWINKETIQDSAYKVSVNKNYVLLPASRYIGCLLNTENQKYFMISAKTLNNTDYRILIHQFDSNGDVITNDLPIGRVITEQLRGTPTTFALSDVSTLTNTFVSASNISAPIIIKLSDNCAKAFIGIIAIGAECRVTRMQIKAKDITNYISLGNDIFPVLADIPTNVGEVGQFVKKASPSSGAIGWVYNGSNWISV